MAVAPAAGTAAQISLNTSKARRSADKVMRSLTSMGLSPDRVSLSTMTSPTVMKVSHATLPCLSAARMLSSTSSEIWSQTLSGFPSVTDSDVKK